MPKFYEVIQLDKIAPGEPRLEKERFVLSALDLQRRTKKTEGKGNAK